MTNGGWINLILSVGFVTVLFLWCLVRVFSQPVGKEKHLAHVEPVDEDKADQR